eukprot:362795-Chlamydomonas_euryale.AAC.1
MPALQRRYGSPERPQLRSGSRARLLQCLHPFPYVTAILDLDQEQKQQQRRVTPWQPRDFARGGGADSGPSSSKGPGMSHTLPTGCCRKQPWSSISRLSLHQAVEFLEGDACVRNGCQVWQPNANGSLRAARTARL